MRCGLRSRLVSTGALTSARGRSIAVVAAAAAVAVSCGGSEDTPPEASAGAGAPPATTFGSTTRPTEDPPANPSVEGRFPVSDGRELALVCWGAGAPTVVLDAGSGDEGIASYRSSPVVEALAERTRVCTYDRAGLGQSDPAPERRRYLDDAARDLHELLAAAQVPGPYLLIGSSGGGFNVFHHAGRYPDEVAGLVLLDVPAGQPNLTAEDVGGSWNGPGNPERMDYVAIERQIALDRLPIPSIPVTVVTARDGQSSDPAEQRVWLRGSSKPKHVVLEGGHDIAEENPQGVLAEIVGVLEAITAGA